jgi:hypothetical protein
VEQLQPFCCNGADEKADARDVAARPVEAGHETKLNRVAAAGENDWYRRGDRLGRQRRTAIRQDRGDLTADEIGGQSGQSIGLLLGPAIFHRHVLTLDVACFLQTIAECGYIECHAGR